MNKSNLRNFAVSARNELIERVKQKAYQLGITEDKVKKAQIESSDAIYINGKSLDKIQIKQRNSLIEQIKGRSYSQVVEEVAYTWFNRFCALRLMEVNNYLPTGIRVLSSTQEGNVEPDILREALHLTEDLDLDPDLVFELRERKDNNDLFKYLLIKECNSLNLLLPFLFEKVEDYTEILFPDNLLKEGSILRTMVNTDYIPESDWQDVEVIGWLYQYYISEKKDQVFADLKRNVKISPENIPAATQLFTPHWIVRYLVENSLGRLWMLNHPESRLIDLMDYYIEPVDTEVDYLKISSPEEIKICDPACGSGHMLTYAFDLLYAIYEESGYVGREIPALILTNNLIGIEIDERAGQLTALALTMKARSRNNNFFRKPVQPRICVLQDIHFDKDELKNYIDEIGHDLLSTKLFATLGQFEEASNFGSLIVPGVTDVNDTVTRLEAIELPNNMFLDATHNKVIQALKQVEYLSSGYHVVVANPPYMGSKGANGRLKTYIDTSYPDSKSDLYAVFIERIMSLVYPNGYYGLMTPFTWMFLSSYLSLRDKIMNNNTILCLVRPEYHSFFDSAYVPICAFVSFRKALPDYSGVYIDLKDFYGYEIQSVKALEAVRNPECKWRYLATTNDFRQLPGSPITYWVDKNIRDIYNNNRLLHEYADVKKGISTANDDYFLKYWYEVDINKVSLPSHGTVKGLKWVPINKGGTFRRWYGNNEFILNWANDGDELINYKDSQGKQKSVPRNLQFSFLEALTYTYVTTGKFNVRYCTQGFMFSAAGPGIFSMGEKKYYLLALLNTKVAQRLIDLTGGMTLTYEIGEISKVPVMEVRDNLVREKIDELCRKNILLAKDDWDSFETSWDFRKPPILMYKQIPFGIPHAYSKWTHVSDKNFRELKANEESLNEIFINLYGIQDELTFEIDDNDVTIHKSEKNREVKALVSYAVGCMFGRYSLDMEGMIFAGGRFNPSQYNTFHADQDNVIPVLADDYFKDDIVARFIDFVRICFSEETLDENLDFIAEALGRKSNETARDTIRRYFINDFYKDHIQMYKKRPIYWMFTSGKEKAFNCLVYLHRYQPDTVATMRTEYLHRLQEAMEVERNNLLRTITEEAGSPAARNASKLLPKLEKQIQELNKYDELVHHYADMRINLDLDDGVKVNYAKLQELLAKI